MDPRSDPRMAGGLTRWHSWPHLREQTVADHSWHVMRILLAVWPETPRELLVHCLVHDVGEMGTGDMPYPVKKNNPVLKREADRIEGDTHLSMCIPWGLPSAQPMPALWKDVFKLAEFVEMWEDAQHELMMGNRFCQPVADRCWAEIEERAEALAAHEPEIAGRASWYCARRRLEWGLFETTVNRFGRVE